MDNDNNGFGILVIILVLVSIGCIIGLLVGTPNYKISNELKTKIEQDAKNSYRNFDEQIGFIINNYYKE